MKTDTRNMVSVTDISKNPSQYIAEAAGGRTLLVLNRNRATVAIVPIGEMERLQDLDEREEDLRMWALAIMRTATDTGERRSLAEVAARHGFDIDELRDGPED